MKKQFLSVAIALPTVLLGAFPSLADTLTNARVTGHTPYCSKLSSCSKKSYPPKVISQTTPTPAPTSSPEPPCPLPRRC